MDIRYIYIDSSIIDADYAGPGYAPSIDSAYPERGEFLL